MTSLASRPAEPRTTRSLFRGGPPMLGTTVIDRTLRAELDTKELDATTARQPLTLPVSGWHVDWYQDRHGRSVIEIANADGDLVGLATSTPLPMLSVDAAWRGTGHDRDGVRQWWALAIGHASAADALPVVSFTRRLGPTGRTLRSVVQPALRSGLWVAAVPGAYTAVSCSQDTAHRIRRLAPVPIFGRS